MDSIAIAKLTQQNKHGRLLLGESADRQYKCTNIINTASKNSQSNSEKIQQKNKLNSVISNQELDQRPKIKK